MKKYNLIKQGISSALAGVLCCSMFFGGASNTMAAVQRPSTPQSAAVLWDETIPANNMGGVTTLNVTDSVDGEYNFGVKFIKGITTAEPFGAWDNIDLNKANQASTSIRIDAKNTSLKGQIGIWYRNVGHYKGKTVDVKATLVNYEFYTRNGNTSNILLFGRTNRIALHGTGFNYLDMKYEFYEAGTNNLLKVKAYMTLDDIDHGQAVQILENQGSLYVPENSNLRGMTSGSNIIFVSDGAWYPDTDTDADHNSAVEDSFMTRFEASSQTQRFYGNRYFRSDHDTNEKYAQFLADYEDFTVWSSTMYYGYSGTPLSRSEVSDPTKVVWDADEEEGVENTLSSMSESYSYAIYHIVPNEDADNYYDSYAMVDTLPDCLELTGASVTDETGKDVTELFDIAQDGQKVTFTCKNTQSTTFYYNTYKFNMNVKVKNSYDMTSYIVDKDGVKQYAIPNQGAVKVSRDGESAEKDTNETKTYVVNLVKYNIACVNKTDENSGTTLADAEFTLYEWDIDAQEYQEIGKLTYVSKREYYESDVLVKTLQNGGKFKIVETKVPNKYTGAWEQEFELTEDDQIFQFNVTNKPIGTETISKTAVVVKPDGTRSEELGATNLPVIAEQDDTIEYHLYISRDCAPGYKSGTLSVTDPIPADAVYTEDTLTIQGEITNAISESTATISNMYYKDGKVVWEITGLDDTEGARLSFQVKAPTKAAILKNVATLIDPDPAVPDILSNETNHEVKVPAYVLEKSSDPVSGTEVKCKDTITYFVKVTNAGEASSKNVIIRDTIPEGTTYVDGSVSCDISDSESTYDNEKDYVYTIIPTLAVGESAILTFEVTVDETEEARTIFNFAQVKDVPEQGKDPKEEVLKDNDYKDSNEVVHPLNKIQAVKSSDPVSGTSVKSGDTITYTIEVINGTPVDAANVLVKDIIPEYTTYVADSAAAETKDAMIELLTIDGKEYVTWILPELKAESSTTVTFQVTVNQLTDSVDVRNVAYVKETPDGSDPKEELSKDDFTKTNETIHPMNKVSIEKSSDPKSGSKVKKDDVITYTLMVKNDSDHLAENVIVKDHVPEYTTYVKDSAKSSVRDTEFKSMTIDDSDCLVWVIPEIKAGNSMKLTFKVTVTTDKTDVEIKNVAFVKEAETDNPFNEAKNDEGFTKSNETVHTIEATSKVTPATTHKATESAGKDGGATAKSVKTDDTTQYGVYIALAALALFLIAGIVLFKKRKKQ